MPTDSVPSRRATKRSASAVGGSTHCASSTATTTRASLPSSRSSDRSDTATARWSGGRAPASSSQKRHFESVPLRTGQATEHLDIDPIQKIAERAEGKLALRLGRSAAQNDGALLDGELDTRLPQGRLPDACLTLQHQAGELVWRARQKGCERFDLGLAADHRRHEMCIERAAASEFAARKFVGKHPITRRIWLARLRRSRHSGALRGYTNTSTLWAPTVPGSDTVCIRTDRGGRCLQRTGRLRRARAASGSRCARPFVV